MADYNPKRYVSGSAASTATAVLTLTGLEGVSGIGFTVSGLSVENLVVNYSEDNGATWSGNCKVLDASTVAASAAATLPNGAYYTPAGFPFNGFRLVKSAATETATVKYILAY